MHAGSVDEAIAAAEQSVAGGAAAGIAHGQQLLHAAGVSTPAAVEATPTPEALQADRAFYEEQAQRAQQQMREQAFDQTQANITPPVPDNAFAQREADLAAQTDALRTQGFKTAEQEHNALQADQAPAVTEAQGFNQPAAPSTLSGAMGAELTRLGKRNLNNLTTTQLGALAAHHPDPAIQDQAAQIAAGRRNAQLVADVQANPENVSTVSANGAMMHGVAAPVEPEFSGERANTTNTAADGLPVTRTTDVTPDLTTEAPAGSPAAVPARSLADTAPELQPLKAAMDADARARGQDAAPGLVPIDTASLPETRTAASNGVEGATTLSQSDAGLLQKTAAIFGKKVVLFRQEGETGGHSTEGAVLPGDAKTIYVNADAAGAHHLVIVGHELAHQMQAEAPNLYKGLQDALLAHAGEGSQNAFYRYYTNRADMSDEQVRQAMADPGVRQRMTDEFIADLVGNRFGEYRTWQQVFADAAGPKADRSLVYRIADFITSFIDKLLANTGFRKFATDDMVGNLTAVRTQVRRALSDYATQAGTKPMQHEADMLRARRDNKVEGNQPKLVEPVKAEPRADVGAEPSKAAPAPVAPREPEPSQGSIPIKKFGQPVKQFGQPRAALPTESTERGSVQINQQEQSNDREATDRTAERNATGEAVSATSPAARELQQSGVVRGSAQWLAEQSRSHQGNDLAGLPSKVEIEGLGEVEFHSFKPAQDAARAYADEHRIDYAPPKTYAKVDPQRATRIAHEFDALKDNPTDPVVRASYDAMIRETVAQYEAALKTGLNVEFIKPDQDDPYAASPRLMQLDVANNNHMWVFSTKDGYGSDFMDPRNPMIAETEHQISGQPALVNDLFRVVHDYFGHVKDGVGFRADGEENAWRSHMAMYSDLARRAATTETRGQNSWVNYGPYAEANRTAAGADTHFADQKIGLLPEWVSEEGRGDEEPSTAAGEERAQANPSSGDPQVRASGERALYLGKLDAAQEAAARAVGGITVTKTYKEQIDSLRKDLGAKLTQGIADEFYPIKKLDSDLSLFYALSARTKCREAA
ncbi:hypothetical protein LMG31841_01579 [Paraburkholderia saeva]|uniref:Uncharacterized protein n=2 Tax=Paraburkholderia saeva TaxID=2777537 RepID=A0A9N8RTV3_9BURK|nr:hypothetical protein LMG31841_01579 [Paraburkholderia saeva]